MEHLLAFKIEGFYRHFGGCVLLARLLSLARLHMAQMIAFPSSSRKAGQAFRGMLSLPVSQRLESVACAMKWAICHCRQHVQQLTVQQHMLDPNRRSRIPEFRAQMMDGRLGGFSVN